MFELRLKARYTRAGTLSLGIPTIFRAIFAFIAAVVSGSLGVSAVAVSAKAGSLGALGPAVGIISLLAALYEERWTFDPASKTVRFRFGLLFAARTLTVPFDAIEGVGVELFVKGSPRMGSAAGDAPEEGEPSGLAAIGARLFRKKRYARLAVYRTDAQALIIESLPAARAAMLEELGREIARVVGAPIRDRDTGSTPPDGRPSSP
jgi:hypothetical protein